MARPCKNCGTELYQLPDDLCLDCQRGLSPQPSVQADKPLGYQSQWTTETSPPPAPQSQYVQEPSYPPNATYAGYSPRPGASEKRWSIIRQLFADAKLVVTRPSIPSFDSIQSHANMRAVLLYVLIDGGAYALVGAIINPAAGVLGVMIGIFFAFFFATGVGWLVARSFGGVGTYRTHVYVMAASGLLLSIADAASILVPPISGLVFLVGIAYSWYLDVLAISSVHRISLGKSVIVGLISLILKLGILFCAFATTIILVLYLLAGHH